MAYRSLSVVIITSGADGEEETKEGGVMSSSSQSSPEDKEEQENELMVLESILDKEQFVYSSTSQSEYSEGECGDAGSQVLPSGQIKVDVELPQGYCISTKVKNGTTEDETKTEEIAYLPPITLLFTLPPNYPSSEGPKFTLQSTWINRQSLSQLCRHLDEIWEKNMGTVILFSWITFLREDTLKVLGCEKQLDIVLPHNHVHHHARRGIKNNKEKESKETAVNVPVPDPSSEASVASSSTLTPSSETKNSGKCHRDRVRNHTYQGDNCLDQRAVFTNPAAKRDKEVMFNYLLEYNKERGETEFQKGFHLCEVCFTDKPGTAFAKLPCSHYFCKTCMTGCYSAHIKDGTIDSVKCLAVKCPAVPSPSQVHELVGNDLYERYDGILLQRALEGMSDLVYCPRLQCRKPVIVEADEKLAFCSHCMYRFCSICKMVFHGVEPCRFKSEEKMKLYEEYQKASREQKLFMEKTYGKKQLAMLVEATLSEKYIEKASKPCPHCKIPIEKSEGCNKITCTKCGSYFCWMCSKQLDKGNPYFHFQDMQSPCFNQLFEDVPGDFGSEDEDFEFDDDDDDFEYEEEEDVDDDWD